LDLSVPILTVMLSLFPLIWIPTSALATTLLRWSMLLSLSLLSMYIVVRRRVLECHASFTPLLLFVFFALLSSIFSPHDSIVWIGETTYRFTGFLSYLCFALLFLLAFAAGSRHSHKVDKIINAGLLSASLVAFFGLLQYFTLNQKSFATLLNSNHFGTYMAMVFPFAALRLLQNPAARWPIAVFVLVYAALLTSLCRGAWVGLAFGLVLLFYYYPQKTKKNLLALGTLVVLVTAAILPFNDWRLAKQTATFSTEVEMAFKGDQDAGSKRLLIWREAIKALPKSPFFGTGPDTLLYGNERIEITPTKAHNIYLEIGVTMGIPALLSYLWFLGCCMASINRRDPVQFAFWLMIAIYLVQGFFLVDVLSVYPLFWVLLGLGVGLSSSLKKSRAADAPI